MQFLIYQEAESNFWTKHFIQTKKKHISETKRSSLYLKLEVRSYLNYSLFLLIIKLKYF